MAKGKSVCEYLKGIRRQIAKANGIDYSPIHCTIRVTAQAHVPPASRSVNTWNGNCMRDKRWAPPSRP
ncbi:MAG: hypothetical protein IKN77_03725 [Paludibacteraceae bacterium]|nr:hypothetical protein [Paludibacteraceae bacterium]